MINVDLVVSINIFQNPNFLDKQLASIASYVLSPYIVILNCNDYMFQALKDRALPSNVYINPEIINKGCFNGTLTQGIVSNMMYVNSRFLYKYFIVLSGRTFFYRHMTLANLDTMKKKWDNSDHMINTQKGDFTDMNWHWPKFRNTLLAKHYLNNGFRLYGEAHEGLVFSYNVAQNILTFLNTNPIIRDDLFTFNLCVEEFALQTISQNEVNPANLEYGFIYIGNGCGETYDPTNTNRYTRKIRYD